MSGESERYTQLARALHRLRGLVNKVMPTQNGYGAVLKKIASELGVCTTRMGVRPLYDGMMVSENGNGNLERPEKPANKAGEYQPETSEKIHETGSNGNRLGERSAGPWGSQRHHVSSPSDKSERITLGGELDALMYEARDAMNNPAAS